MDWRFRGVRDLRDSIYHVIEKLLDQLALGCRVLRVDPGPWLGLKVQDVSAGRAQGPCLVARALAFRRPGERLALNAFRARLRASRLRVLLKRRIYLEIARGDMCGDGTDAILRVIIIHAQINAH